MMNIKQIQKLVKTVTTAGTAEPLTTTETLASSYSVQAKKVTGDNAGNIHIGTSTLDKGAAEEFELEPLDLISVWGQGDDVFNLADVYIDADTSGDGVIVRYVPARTTR